MTKADMEPESSPRVVIVVVGSGLRVAETQAVQPRAIEAVARMTFVRLLQANNEPRE